MFERQKESENGTVGEGDKEYEHLAQKAALLLVNSFKALLDDSIKKLTDHIFIDLAPLRSQLNQILNKQQEILDQMPADLAQLETLPTKVQTNQQQIIYSLERIEKQLVQLNAESKLLENASQENRLLGQEHYQNDIVQPMVRSLFPIVDFINDAKDRSTNPDADKKIDADGLIDAIFTQLQQFLAVYQIEPIRHKPKAKFDPRMMRPVKTVPTDNRQLDNRIAKSLQAGFWWRKERILRFESVALYKFKDSKSITENLERV
jgi:hypothetical protein